MNSCEKSNNPIKMKIEIISSETIKPSSPTPPHLLNMTLSFLDKEFPPLVTPTLLFYDAPIGELDMTRLKTCLSKTLTSFYPLAGRFQTLGTILCNDEGVPFVEARVNCPLSTALSSISSNLISYFPPNRDDLIASGIQLAFQINVFSCGGFAIGLYHTHKVTDGISVNTFLRHWAALVTEHYDDATQAKPDFNAGVKAFPPVLKKDNGQEFVTPALNPDKPKGERIFIRSFQFGKRAVTELKSKSLSDRVPNPSRLESVAGFLWKQLMLSLPEKEEVCSIFSVVVDLRAWSDPPLPDVSMGNLFEVAWARIERRVELPELVQEIHETISKMKDMVSEYQGDKRGEAKEKYWQNFLKAVSECKGRGGVYTLTSWCNKAGFGDVNFGFGKPKWVIPIDGILDIVQRNTIVLTEYRDSEGDGFEAWLFLEEHAIKFLETCPDFLAFANSPNFKLDNASFC